MMPPTKRSSHFVGLLCVLSLSALSYGARPSTELPTRRPSPPAAGTGRTSALCQALSGRFLGLPREEGEGVSTLSPAFAGRLFIERCHVETEGGTVRLSVGGPAWYWLEREEDGFAIRQPVALDVETTLMGEFGYASQSGILSLYFRPTADPDVSVQVTNDVDVEPQTFWATILNALPFALVSAKAEGRIHDEVETRFGERLEQGATFTVDLRSFETDMALGHLAAGQTPHHPFEDGAVSLANERQLLFPGGVHVVGPFEPASEIPFDVVVERGSGLAYELACARDIELGIGAAGAIPRLDPKVARTSGRLEGVGAHHASLTLRDCQWCLVTTSADDAPSVAALRIRPGFARE